MLLNLDVRLHYHMPVSTDLLLQVEAANAPNQIVRHANIQLSDTEYFSRVAGENGIGERIWLRVHDDFTCQYNATIEINRPALDLSGLNAVLPHLLPDNIVQYLMPSRYCPADEFQNFTLGEFDGLSGGPLVMAMRQWIGEKVAYVPGSSGGHTTALDSFVQRQGVCRDFAHLMITLARAAAIPARFASVYAPHATPQDFHAVAEIYLDNAWHLVDATGMSSPENMAVIGVGPDAAGVAFMTTYGAAVFQSQSVDVQIAEA